jgi:hypothetical protein
VPIRLEPCEREHGRGPDREAAPQEELERRVLRRAQLELLDASARPPNPLTRAHDAQDSRGVAQRYFTPEEANAALRRVRPVAERLVAHQQALREAQARHTEVLGRIAGDGGGIQPSELAQLATSVEREATAVAGCVEEIHAQGAQVKDLDQGLVDFPALHDGVEVCLCWRVGEDAIAYWHGADEGVAGRKPLPF